MGSRPRLQTLAVFRRPPGAGGRGQRVRQARTPPRDCSSIRIGATGSGKSENLLGDLDWRRRNRKATVLLDSKGDTARAAYANAMAAGADNAIYIKLNSAWVLGVDLLRWSKNIDLYIRENTNRQIAGWFKQIFIASQDDSTDRDQPWKQDWVDAIQMLHRYQITPKPLTHLYWGLDLNSPEYKQMLRDCTNPDMIRKFAGMEEIVKRNPVQADAQLGGARRRLKPVTSPLIAAATTAKHKMSMEWLIQGGYQLYVDGAGTDKEEFRVYALMMTLLTMATAKDIADRTNETPGVHIDLEEAGAGELVPNFVVEGTMTLRSVACFFDVLSQSLLDLGDNASRLLQNCPLKRFFNSTSDEDVSRISGMLTMASFDSREVHYTTQRSLSRGVKEIKTKTTSRNKTGSIQKQMGAKDRVSEGASENETEGTAYIPDTEIVTDEHYVSTDIDRHKHSRNLYGFDPGWFYELLSGVVRIDYHPMIQNPWDNTVRFPVQGLPGEELFPTGAATLYEYRFARAVAAQSERFPFIQRSTWQPTTIPPEVPATNGQNSANRARARAAKKNSSQS